MASLKILAALTLAAVFLPGHAVRLPQNPEENPAPLPWWKEDIIYQVYPRSHQDSDGDGVGDLQGIIQRLDHFVELGVKAVWLSPIYKSPMKDFGYDISDFKDIEPQFGTMADFEELSTEMKKRGIRLIMDFVPNHSSDQHEWFGKSIRKEGKYADYYVWKDANGVNATDGKPIPPNNWNSVFGGSAWDWVEERQQFYLHQFTPGQPDLNFENRDVIVEMLSIMKFWMDKGVDGFRVDATPHMFEDQKFLNEPLNPNRGPDTRPTDHSYLSHIYTYDLPGGYDVLAEMRSLIDIYTLSDGIVRVMFVEATNPTLESLFKWYGTPERPIAHFPFNFEFINRIRPGFSGNDVAGLVDEWFCKMPEGNWPNWLMGNHDNKRVGTRFGSWVVDPFNMLLLLLPGNAVTYYGEEIGMTNANITWEDTVDPPACAAGPERYEQMSRDPERTPMQWDGTSPNAGFSTSNKTWLPMHPDWNLVNVESQKNAPGLSHMKVYQEVAKLRHSDIWRYGSMESKAAMGGKVFVFARVYNDEGFVYVANFGDEELTLNITDLVENVPGEAKVYVTSVDYSPTEIIPGAIVNTENLRVGPKHGLVLVFPNEFVPTDPPTTQPPSTSDPGMGSTTSGTDTTQAGSGGTEGTTPSGTETTQAGSGGTEGTTPSGTETTQAGSGGTGGTETTTNGSDSGCNEIFNKVQVPALLLISVIFTLYTQY